jgi:hypothetical protein
MSARLAIDGKYSSFTKLNISVGTFAPLWGKF